MKVMVLFLVFVSVIGLAACGDDESRNGSTDGRGDAGEFETTSISGNGGEAHTPSGGSSGIEAGTADSGDQEDAGSVHIGVDVEAALPQTISSAQDHTCWLDTEGTIHCEGDPFPDWTDPPAAGFVRIAIENNHGCAIDEAGKVTCWGQGEEEKSECYESSFEDHCGQSDPPDGEFIDIAVGKQFSCGVTSRAELVCWGKAPYGQGRIEGNFKQVAARGDLMCALAVEGEAYCWMEGEDQSIDIGSELVEVAVTGGWACGLNGDGEVYCNLSSQPLEDSRFSRISAGGNHACGIRLDGSMECWGSSNAHRIPPPEGKMVEIAPGSSHICAKFEDDLVQCWGREFGDGGGEYQCAVDEAQLTGSVDGNELSESYELHWMDDRNTDTYYEYLMWFDSGFVLLRGSEPGLYSSYMPHFTVPDGESVLLDYALLHLGVTDSNPGQFYCAGSGSLVNRVGDEGLLDLKNVVALGACEDGTSVTGEVSFCYDTTQREACDTLSGTVDGHSMDGEAEFIGNVRAVRVRSGNDLYLVRTIGDSEDVSWGIILTDPNGPHAGATYCAGFGSSQTIEERATFDRRHNYTFTNLTRIDGCAGVIGSGTLSGCIR